jgi:cytochrome c553
MRHLAPAGWIAAGVLAALAMAAPVTAGPLDHPGYTKTFTCSACHGFGGNSKSDAMPILAGMDAAYLKKALQDYAAGRRLSAEMEPYAKMALHVGVDDVAQYFAAQKKEPSPIAIDAAAVARGKTASTQCAGCHGEKGQGDRAKLVPDLTGQPPGYLHSQMMLFKTDKRGPGDAKIREKLLLMKQVPDETIANLAAYYSSIR